MTEEQVTSQNKSEFPMESTVLFHKLSESKTWARFYLALCELFEKNICAVSTKDIYKHTYEESFGRFAIGMSHAHNMFKELELMKLTYSARRGHRDKFVLTDSLINQRLKKIADNTISLKVTK